MFRVYIRAPDLAVCDKTVTDNPEAARVAFQVLTERADLDGSAMITVLNRDGRPLAYHRFDGVDPMNQWRGRTDQIDFQLDRHKLEKVVAKEFS